MKKVTNNELFSGSPSGAGGLQLYFLIGIMGSGKTYWAQRLSALLQIDWIDLDQQIEKACEMSIKEIFATESEDYFRSKERDTLRQLGSVDKLVIACGGGTPCFHDNMDWMNENGITIWLQPDIDELVIRLQRGKHKRPLISHLGDNELKAFVAHKLKEREPFYSKAQYHLRENSISLDTFTQLFLYA